MTYYDCAKFHCLSVFSFKVSARGGGGGEWGSKSTKVSENTIGF